MKRINAVALWLLELASLVVILVCSWLLLDREVFALVAATIVLFTSLYLEHTSVKAE